MKRLLTGELSQLKRNLNEEVERVQHTTWSDEVHRVQLNEQQIPVNLYGGMELETIAALRTEGWHFTQGHIEASYHLILARLHIKT